MHEGAILPFVTGSPKFVVWGERVFMLYQDVDLEPGEPLEVTEARIRLGEPVIYREEFYTAVLPLDASKPGGSTR